MTPYLLDVNLLIALLWRSHEHHEAAQRWFAASSESGWATCTVSELAFVRIVSNPSFSVDAVRPQRAAELLAANLRHPTHSRMEDRWDIPVLLEPFTRHLTGHRQVTDAHLLGLAGKHGGRLATFDAGIVTLASNAGQAGWAERIPIH